MLYCDNDLPGIRNETLTLSNDPARPVPAAPAASSPLRKDGDVTIANAGVVDLYAQMLRIRLIEDAIAARYAEGQMRCPVHLSIGQEAAAVGVSAALRIEDRCFSTHRCHAHYLAKGGDLDRMLAEIHGKETGCLGGRGGSMHLMDADVGMELSVPIVGSSIPLAVGYALADRMDGKDRVSVAYFGDAAVEEGVFHESANFAALRKLAVLFVCENNLFSVYTHLNERQPDRPLEALAQAHGFPGIRCDGNDVEAVLAAAQSAVARARAGEGPTLLVLDTYRWREHCGPNFDDHLGYREPAEWQAWQGRDPVASAHARLRNAGLLDDAAEAALRARIDEEIRLSFDRALAAPLPDPATAGDFVYA